MKRFAKILSIIVAVVLLLFGAATASLFMPSVQQYLQKYATEYLAKELQTELSIDSVSFKIHKGSFALYGLDIKDRKDIDMLHADTLYAHVNIKELLQKQIHITDIELTGTTANLYKENPDTAANYQFVIDTFKKEKKEKKEKEKEEEDENKLNLSINHIRIARTSFDWAVHSTPNSKISASLDFAEFDKDEQINIHINNLKSEIKGNQTSIHQIDYSSPSADSILTKDAKLAITGLHLTTDNHKPRKNKGKPNHGAFDAGHMNLNADISITLDKFEKDSIEFSINNIKGKDEASGLQVDKMSCHIKTDKKNVSINNLTIKDQSTVINIPSIEGNETYFKVPTLTAYTVLRDIAQPFSPALKNFTTPLNLTLSADGNLDKINLHNIKINTKDKRLQIAANGYIKNLQKSKALALHFDVRSMTANNNIKEQIVGHFRVKKSMLGILNGIGNIAFTGSVDIPYKHQLFRGKLKSGIGDAIFNIELNNYTRYMSGNLSSEAIDLGKLIGNPNIGNIVFNTSFSFDIAGKNSAKQLGRKLTPLPAGWAKGKTIEASYKKLKLRNILFDITSNGYVASGEVKKEGKLIDLLCSFSFDDTNFAKNLKVKPAIKVNNIFNIFKSHKKDKEEKGN